MNSSINGSFYGPQVNSVGGNFAAEFPSAAYMGIFGGGLVNTPAP